MSYQEKNVCILVLLKKLKANLKLSCELELRQLEDLRLQLLDTRLHNFMGIETGSHFLGNQVTFLGNQVTSLGNRFTFSGNQVTFLENLVTY